MFSTKKKLIHCIYICLGYLSRFIVLCILCQYSYLAILYVCYLKLVRVFLCYGFRSKGLSQILFVSHCLSFMNSGLRGCPKCVSKESILEWCFQGCLVLALHNVLKLNSSITDYCQFSLSNSVFKIWHHRTDILIQKL